MLNYPLNSDLILRKKHALKRALLAKEHLLPKNIAILGGSTTSEIKNILEVFLLNLGIQPNFYESEYNQYFEDAVFPNEALEHFKPDVIYLHTTHKNVSSFPDMHHTPEQVESNLQKDMQKFSLIWASLVKYNCVVIQNNFDLPQERILGNLDFYDHRGAVSYIHKLNAFFAQEAQIKENFYIHDIHYLSASLGLFTWFDRKFWYSYKYAVSYEAIPHLAKSLATMIGAIFGKSKKCMVLDLDNTCWGGIIGDNGLSGIAIGKETALAEAYTDFQRYVKKLKDRGITLGVCSKNDFENAQEGFLHPDTVLVEGDFAVFEANWNPKHENIAKISETLNLGLDSFLFVDDNPAERHIVRSNLPMVSVPEVGDDIVNFIDHIDKNGYFETVLLSKDDLKRSEFYSENAERLKHEYSFTNYGEYLHSLEMRAEILPFAPIYLDRITQLINKTNQFNLTTKRYTQAEIELIAHDPNYITLYGKLEDKFGDNGLISVVIGQLINNECHILLWLMSCRVLKRNMEQAMLDKLVACCQKIGIQKLIGYYYPTSKNKVVVNLYGDLGFDNVEMQQDGSTIWHLSLEQYENRNFYIEKINEQAHV